MTRQDKPAPPQLNAMEFREYLRPHVPEAIKHLVELMRSAPNDSVRLGAIKILLAKVLPDLKSTDLTGSDGKSIIEKIIIQTNG